MKAHSLVVLALCVLVTACAAPLQTTSQSAVYRQDEEVQPVAPAPAAATPTVTGRPQATVPAAPAYYRAPEPNSAAAALLRDANVALAQNDLARAASTAERAQRVAPRDPSVYLTLSRIRCTQGSYGQCEQLARKALSLQPSLGQREEAQRLIARARTEE